MPARSPTWSSRIQKSDLIPAIEVAIGRFRELQHLTGEVDALGEQLEARKIIDRAKGLLIDECRAAARATRSRSSSARR